MEKLKSFWKKPTETYELILSKDINWFKTVLFFSCNGIIIMYYIMKSQEMINIESFKMTILTIFFMLLIGMIYGLVTNFIVGFLIKLTGKFFNGKNDLKKIYTVLSWSYYPLTISVYLIIVNILISRIILMTEIDTFVLLFLSLVVITFTIIQGILGIWQLILLFRGLKIAQGLSTTNTILNYLSGAFIFGLFYFLLTYKFL
jgi:hypothetical protein